MSSYNVINGKNVIIDGDSLRISAPIQSGITFGPRSTDSYNVGIGLNALASRTSAVRDTIVGDEAGSAITTGSFNTFVGFSAGDSTTTGQHDVFLGNDAGFSNIAGSECVCVGSSAGRANNANYNTYMGFETAKSATGVSNTCLGHACAFALTTGTGNVIIGKDAGSVGPTTGAGNIIIANSGASGDVGIIRIGTSGTHVKNFQQGIAGITTDAAAVACLVSGTGQLGVTSCNVEKKKEWENLDEEQNREFLHSMPIRKYKYKQGHQAVNIGPNVEDLREICDKLYPDFIVKNEDGSDLGLATQNLQWAIIKDLQRMQKAIDKLEGVEPKYKPNYELKGLQDDSEIMEPAFKRQRIQ